MDLSSLKPCDLWTSLCHPMPGLMQKGLGRQRDAQPSRYHLTALIYCTHGANLPFFWPAQIYTDFRVDFGEYFFTGWKVFFSHPFSCEPGQRKRSSPFVVLKGCCLWKLGALMIPSASVLYAAVIWRISIWSYTALTAGLHGALLSAAARAAMSTEDAPHSAAARQFHHQRSVLTRHSHPWWKRHD